MNEYSIEEIKAIFDEARKQINDGIEEGNSYWYQGSNGRGYVESWAQKKANEVWEKTREQAWDNCFTRLEEKYPECLSDKHFVNIFVKDIFQFTTDSAYKTMFFDRFSGDGQIELLDKFQFSDYEVKFPEAVEKLNKDILERISPSDYQRLKLQDYETETEMASYLEMQNCSRKVPGKKGNIIEQGIQIIKKWDPEWDEEEERYIEEESFVSVYVPLSDFSKAEVWGEDEIELSEAFMAIAETVKHLPYKNMLGLLKQMELLPRTTSKKNQQNFHDISEITEVVADRSSNNINEVVNEISEEMKETSRDNNEPTIDN